MTFISGRFGNQSENRPLIEMIENFTQFKNPFKQGGFLEGVAWFANDLAYIDSKGGFLNTVAVKIYYFKEYEYAIPIS